jgi:hypothetical protein
MCSKMIPSHCAGEIFGGTEVLLEGTSEDPDSGNVAAQFTWSYRLMAEEQLRYYRKTSFVLGDSMETFIPHAYAMQSNFGERNTAHF